MSAPQVTEKAIGGMGVGRRDPTGYLARMILLLLPIALAQDAGFETTLWRAQSDELHYYWIPETAVTAALIGGYFASGDLDPRRVGREALPTGIDATDDPRWNSNAAVASDILGLPVSHYGLNLPVLSVLGVGLWGGLRDESAGAGAMHSLIALESYMATIGVTETLKLAVSRPRPYTSAAFQADEPAAYAGEEIQHDLSKDGHYDAYKSFPSGHTSGTAALGFSIATLLARDAAAHDGPAWVAPTAYGAAGAWTVAVATLRVVAGKHHPTDTIVGGLIGAGVGTGLTWLHTTDTGASLSARMHPSGAQQGASLQWSGVW